MTTSTSRPTIGSFGEGKKPLIDTLSTGKAATFIVFQTPEEGIGIPVDLKGFADGFAALP